MARYFQIRSIKEVAQQYFSEYMGNDEQEHEVRLLSDAEWVKIVGERVAQHASPLYIERGVLIVKTDHAAWNHFILLNSNAIIRALTAANKSRVVHSIKVKSG